MPEARSRNRPVSLGHWVGSVGDENDIQPIEGRGAAATKRGSLNSSKDVNNLSRYDRGGLDELAPSSAVNNTNQKRFQHQGDGKRRRKSRSADCTGADGVSGSGKSTVALELHRVLVWPFQEMTTSILRRISRKRVPAAHLMTPTGCLGCGRSQVGSTSAWPPMSPASSPVPTSNAHHRFD